MPWNLTGNAGTNPARQFLGTTDNRPLIIRTNGAEAMRVNPDGNVGIANATPTGKLHIGSSQPNIFLLGDTTVNQDGLRIHYNESAGLRTGVIDVKGSSFRIRGESGNTGGGATERLLINLANGNVGIANDSPAGKLHIGGPQPDIFLVGNTTANQDGLRIHYNETVGSGVIDVKGLNFQIRGESFGVGGGSTERLLINLANGNVGIGTTNPSSRLDVEGSTQLSGNIPETSTIINATNSGFGYAAYGSISQGATFGGLAYEADDEHEGRFGEFHARYGVRGETQEGYGVGGHSDNGVGVVGSTTNRLAGWFFGPVVIENSHTNAPALSVGGLLNQNVEFGGTLFIGMGLPTQSAGTARIRIGADNANNDIEIGSTNPQIQDISFWNTGSGTWMNTRALAFNTMSDMRLKSKVQPLTDVMEKLEQIRGVSFEWKDVPQAPNQSTEIREIGVIAQEVEAVFPEIVSSSGTEGYKAVDYGSLTAILIEAVKQLRSENNLLHSRLEALEQHAIR